MQSPASLTNAVWRKELRALDYASSLFPDGGISHQREPLYLPVHSHEHHELHFLARGTMIQLLEDGFSLKAQGGDLMLTQPGVRHRGAFDIIPPSLLLWLKVAPKDAQTHSSGLTKTELADITARLTRAGNTVVAAPELHGPFRRLQALLALDKTDSLTKRIQVGSVLTEIMALALEALDRGHRPVPSPWIETVMARLAEHHTPQSVATLASHAGLSPSRFHARFLKETGETPAACHLRQRIDSACRQLRSDPRISIASVASEHGFHDPRYFATCVRRLTGLSPSRIRSLLANPWNGA